MESLSKFEEADEFEKQFSDIEGEKWREYEFPGGHTVRINDPRKLLVKSKTNGDSHKIIDAYGIRHYIPAGWLTFRFDGIWIY